jgi:hypothetical protein
MRTVGIMRRNGNAINNAAETVIKAMIENYFGKKIDIQLVKSNNMTVPTDVIIFNVNDDVSDSTIVDCIISLCKSDFRYVFRIMDDKKEDDDNKEDDDDNNEDDGFHLEKYRSLVNGSSEKDVEANEYPDDDSEIDSSENAEADK